MSPRRAMAALGALLLSVAPGFSQSVSLVERPTPGDLARCKLELTLSGNLLVREEAGQKPIKLQAQARHEFLDRTLSLADGFPARSARYYREASSVMEVGGERVKHSLGSDRKLVIAQRSAQGLFCYSPEGPLTRDELDLVSEHFDPQCMAGLLPGKEVAIGETWVIPNPVAQAAGLLDGLIKTTLTGKLTAVADGIARIQLEGSIEGIEDGSKVTLTIVATGQYHMTQKRLIALDWKQHDEREHGPVNPASRLDAHVVLTRESLHSEPKELARVATLPVEPTAEQSRLRYGDPKTGYQFAYSRDWHITGQSGPHLMLRLLDRGELIAQATITDWKKAEAGKHSTPDEFRKAIAESRGWMAGQVVESRELPIDGGRWLYRLTAEGLIDQIPVVQGFHLLAGPRGEQLVVTFVMKPEKVKAIGTRDVEFVKSIVFGQRP